VRVPVLSEQILSALPITSQDASFFTSHPSLVILYMEKASEIITASGKPSGTATTITTTPTITY